MKDSKQSAIIAAVNHVLAQRRDISQKDVAARAEISQSYLSRILSGHHGALGVDLLDAICRAVGMSLADAMTRGDRLCSNLTVGQPDAPPPDVVTLEKIYAEMEKIRRRLETSKGCPIVEIARRQSDGTSESDR